MFGCGSTAKNIASGRPVYTRPAIFKKTMANSGVSVCIGRMRASERAYEALREDILEWRLVPGTVLAEVEQSERLGVSRTPLREALSRLTAEGLTAAAGGSGMVVTDISLEAIDELFELRETLECRAAALAAQRGDPSIFAQLHARHS